MPLTPCDLKTYRQKLAALEHLPTPDRALAWHSLWLLAESLLETHEETMLQQRILTIDLCPHYWERLQDYADEAFAGSLELLTQELLEKKIYDLEQQVLSPQEMATAAQALIGGAVPVAQESHSELLKAFLSAAAPFPPSLKLDIAALFLQQLKSSTCHKEVHDETT